MIEPNEWHMIVVLTETALLLETKAGPFDAAAAKELALWAPDERRADAAAYCYPYSVFSISALLLEAH